MGKLTKSEKEEQQHFNELASIYDKNYGYNDPFSQYKIKKKSEQVVKVIKNIGSRKVKILEIGCGTGEYSKYLAKYLPNAQITAIDISDRILKIAKNKCKKEKNIKFYAKSAYSTKFGNNSFDVIIGFYVLHHLQLDKLHKELLRILAPGGVLVFYEPNILNPIVYAIKSIPFLKRKIGDSPGEWAINPLTVENTFKGLTKDTIVTSEYVIPVRIISHKFKVLLDRYSERFFAKTPILKMLGGSVFIVFKNNDK